MASYSDYSPNNVPASSLGPLTEKEKYDFRQLEAKMKALASTTPSSKRVVRSTKHETLGRSIMSWKCTEYLYKKDPCPLPTQARGLFSSDQEEGDGDQVIIARGYDKFFNIGEVPKTKWEWINQNTQGPYELTVKENGCLVLAAGINSGKDLLVTSKHSINTPHAQAGSSWVDKHVGKVGKTREDFAAFLYENNATAIFELCDDDFEEHILEYPERLRGLHMHGICRNVVDLDIWPSTEVARVAENFGFIKNQYFVFDTAEEGKQFADEVRQSKMLDGRAIEGFVVRCRADQGAHPFMFKIKYDEPYLMFREWREITGRIIAEKPFKTRYPLSKVYAEWVKKEIKESPSSFENFVTKGVIGTRKRFLKYYESLDGTEPIEVESTAAKKLLVFPVGTIGCGKTTVCLALSKLFGFAHIQNDNIKNKKGHEKFNNAVIDAFDKNDIVIADRNNHLALLRKSLTTAVRKELPECQLVALYWSHENASAAKILDKTMDRVIKRGENHQLLVASLPNVGQIMRKFVNTFVPLDMDSSGDGLIDDVIELDPVAESSQNLRVAVDYLCKSFPDLCKRPTEQEMDAALKSALEYKPEILFKSNHGQQAGKETKKIKEKKEREPKQPMFIGLVPVRCNVIQWFKNQMNTRKDVDWAKFTDLVGQGSNNHKRHITLAHIAHKKDEQKKKVYDGYMSLFSDKKPAHQLTVKCTADYVVSNGSIAALRVSSMEVNGDVSELPEDILKQQHQRSAETDAQAEPSVDADATESKRDASGSREVRGNNLISHITLGTDGKTKPVVSNDILKTVFGPENAASPINVPCEWAVIPVTLTFDAVLHKFVN
ncbi:tRNA ligase [Coemansia sp. RSA 485]|nr:tRNA ligase [Coemansia sp. RSA 485]